MKVFETYSGSDRLDCYFKTEQEAKQFVNYFNSLHGESKTTSKSKMFTNIMSGRNVDPEDYPFTLSFYISDEDFASYVALFPEERENNARLP